jgi:hypothetical protein
MSEPATNDNVNLKSDLFRDNFAEQFQLVEPGVAVVQFPHGTPRDFFIGRSVLVAFNDYESQRLDLRVGSSVYCRLQEAQRITHDIYNDENSYFLIPIEAIVAVEYEVNKEV